MTMQPLQARHFQVLSKQDPALHDIAAGVRGHAMGDGALPAKVKSLMAMLADALNQRPEAVGVFANIARSQGASEQEIAETVGVAYWLGGVHALSNASHAFEA